MISIEYLIYKHKYAMKLIIAKTIKYVNTTQSVGEVSNADSLKFVD